MKPTFTVIAGINGAGKTSLYRVLNGCIDFGDRVNTDEIALELCPENPSSSDVQVRAGKLAVRKIRDCIAARKSFHIETTLPGNAIYKYMVKASEHGFYVILLFVGIDDINVALDRVHRRKANGGHGIADDYIIKRFGSINDNLKKILPVSDEAYIYDNTVKLRQIAVIKSGKVVDCDAHQPYWFMRLIDNQVDSNV